jgi:hypothetical protein
MAAGAAAQALLSTIPARTPLAATDIAAASYLSPNLVSQTLPSLCEKGCLRWRTTAGGMMGRGEISVGQSATKLVGQGSGSIKRKRVRRGVRKAVWLTP